MTTKQDKNGKHQGCFQATAQTFTIDGKTVEWSGRGRMPKELKAAIEAGTIQYVPPFKAAKEALKAHRQAEKAAKQAQKDQMTEQAVVEETHQEESAESVTA